LRATAARVNVLTALEVLDHATPEAVFSFAGSRTPGLNLSTVYRTLGVLGEHGVVGHAHLDHTAPTYMLASHAMHAHWSARVPRGVRAGREGR
jgi:Fur family ferric uptake transcriptional regulator